MKEYVLEVTQRKYVLPDECCVFCKFCSDVWYDSHGVHKIWCDKQNSCADFGNFPNICKQFQEDE